VLEPTIVTFLFRVTLSVTDRVLESVVAPATPKDELRVVGPDTPRDELKVVVDETAKVPVIEALDVEGLNTNLSTPEEFLIDKIPPVIVTLDVVVSELLKVRDPVKRLFAFTVNWSDAASPIVTLLLAISAPVKVVVPVTPRVELKVVAPVTPRDEFKEVVPITPSAPEIVVLPDAESTRNLVTGVPAPSVILKNSVAGVVLPAIVKPPLNVARLVAVKVPVRVVLPVTPRVELSVVAPVTPKVELSVVAPVTPRDEFSVVAPVTPSVPAIVVLPDAAVILNLLVLMATSPVIARVLLSVVAPVTFNDDERVVTAATANVPAITVFPDAEETVNLFVLIVKLPL